MNDRQGTFNCIYFITTLLLILSMSAGDTFAAFNSIVLILLFGTWLAEGDFKNKFERLRNEPFFKATLIFYIPYLIGLLTSHDKHTAFEAAQRELAIPLLSMIYFSRKIFRKELIINIFKFFVLSVFVWMFINLFVSIGRAVKYNDVSYLFYHKLTSPTRSTAIMGAFLCELCLALLLFMPVFKKRALPVIITMVFLVLLASKMYLFISLILLLKKLYGSVSKRLRLISFAAVLLFVVLLAFVPNPVKERYEDMEKFKFSYLTEPVFNKNIYFDGLSLRLVYWRFSYEILNEHQGYILGTGTGDSRALLDKKIIDYHMNLGSDNGHGKRMGYLRYSFHDNYLESMVSSGVVGLFCLLWLLVSLFVTGKKYRSGFLLSLALIVSLASLTDVMVINKQCYATAFILLVYLGIRYAEITFCEKNVSELMCRN